MDQVYLRQPSESFAPELFTYQDLLVELMDSGGVRVNAADDRRLRSAVLTAYRDLYNKRSWNFAHKSYTFRTSAEVTLTGYYDHTGGSSERLFTVVTGTVPSWLRDAAVLIEGVPYEPDAAVSTNFTLTLRNNPGQDVGSVGSPATVKVVRILYPMPADFISPFQPETDSRGSVLWSTRQVMDAEAMYHIEYGEPRYAAQVSHPKLYGSKALRIWPYSSTSRVISLLYRSKGRDLAYSGFTGCRGTFSLDIGVDANRATLTGITVTSRMVGSVFRLRSDTNTPEGVSGQYPYEQQATIIAVDTGSNYVYLDRDLTASLTAKACVISDPVDLPQYALTPLRAMIRFALAIADGREARDVQLAASFLNEQMVTLAENDRELPPGSRQGYCYDFQDDDEMSYSWVT